MKLRIIYYFFALALLAFIFQSRSGGPASVADLLVTGSPGSVGNMGTCANSGCHVSGSFDPSLTLELLDGSGTVVEKYIPGSSYTFRLTIGAGNGNPSAYGWQANVLDSGNNEAGGWPSFPPGGSQLIIYANGDSYWEQSSPSNQNTQQISWTAPDSNTGDITFYVAGLAINGNGSPAGDGTVAGSLTIQEDVDNNTIDLSRDFATINIFPNPVADEMNLDITSRTSGTFDLNFVDVSGRVLRTETISLTSGKNERSFNVSDLQTGYYLIQLCGDEYVTAKQMIKK